MIEQVLSAAFGGAGRAFRSEVTSMGGVTAQPAGNYAGAVITEPLAMRIAAVTACVRLIAGGMAMCPIGLYKRLPDGSRAQDRELSLDYLLRLSPSAEIIASSFWESAIQAMFYRGGSVVRVVRDRRGHAVALYHLPNVMVSVQGGRRRFAGRDETGQYRVFDPEEIWYMPAFSIDGGLTGVSVIQYGARTLGAAMAAEQQAESMYRNGLNRGTAIKYPHKLKPEQRDEMREAVQKISGAINAGKTPLLEQGMEISEIGVTPVDAELLATRKWSVEEICRLFQVPPHMVGHTEKNSSWGTGMEQMMQQFVTFTLGPWAKRIEQSITKFLIPVSLRATHYAEYNFEGLLRADSKGRADFYRFMVSNGVMTRDEVRRKENLPARGGNADVLMAQTAQAPIDTL